MPWRARSEPRTLPPRPGRRGSPRRYASASSSTKRTFPTATPPSPDPSEERLLGRRRPLAPEVGARPRRDRSTAGCPVEEPDLDEVGLVDLLDRSAFFADR